MTLELATLSKPCSYGCHKVYNLLEVGISHLGSIIGGVVRNKVSSLIDNL